MKLTHLELRRVDLPLVTPFRTSNGIQSARDALLVRALGPDAEGWGECVAMSEPLYSSEHVDGAQQVITRYLAPRIDPHDVVAATVASRLAPVCGHPMAKAAVEAAVLDAELRVAGQSLGQRLGATTTRIPSGVSVGVHSSVGALLDTVDGYLSDGYRRVKLKIEPGWDIEPVEAVRKRFGDIALQVDANGAYTVRDARHLAKLDSFDLLLIEQPLAQDDLRGHRALGRLIRTPICLDESIVSARSALDAIELEACRVINIKPGRVGGLLEAVRIHDICVARNIPVWCGGMLETGIGRAGNVALAALPGFTLPGDTSASGRFFRHDITEPFVLVDGYLAVPTGPGIGVTPIADVLADLTTSIQTVALGR